MQLSREAIQRMVNAKSGVSGGGGNAFDPSILSEYATQDWVDENYLSLDFFNAIFKAKTSNGVDVLPNQGDLTTIDNIQAMFGFWTEQYISALGQGDDGGGSVTTLAQLNDVELSLPLNNGEVLTYNSTLGKWTNGTGVSTAWANITGKPTTIAGYGITDAHITNGTITLGSASITPITSLTGYATESWVTGVLANYVTTSGLTTTLADYVTASALNTTLASYVTTSALSTTLADYVTNTSLTTTLAAYGTKSWVESNYISKAFFNRLFRAFAPVAEGESEAAQVEPNDVTTEIDNIKAMFGLWTEQYLSALGLSAGGGGGYTLNEPLASINSAALGTPSQANVAIVWNGTAWVYGTTMSSVSWNDVTNKPTTIAGYGITDAYISNGTITLGSNSITPVTSLSGYATQSWVQQQGYITGITSSMVTSALGYTPANSASLANYLPLSGGTMTDAIIFGGNATRGTNTTGHARIGEYDHVGGLVIQLSSDSTSVPSRFEVINAAWSKAILMAGPDENSYNGQGYCCGSGARFGTFGDKTRYENSVPYYISTTPNSTGWVFCAGSDVGGMLLGVDTNGDGFLGTHSNTNMIVRCGNVGIGTSSPTYKLQVSGDVYASSFIKSGGTSSQFLKADGSVDSNSYALSSALGNYLPLSGGTMTDAIIFGGNKSNGTNTTGHARIGEYDHIGGLVIQLGSENDYSANFEVINKPWNKPIFSAGYDSVSGYTSSLFVSSAAPRGKFGDLDRYENSVPYQITATPQSSDWVLCVGANASGVLLGTTGTYGKIGVHNNNPLHIVSNYVGVGSSTYAPQYQLDVEGQSRATGGAILGNVRVGINSSGTTDINACIEMMTGTAYIDWHYQGSSSDYTTRLIESSSGVLTLEGSITATGGVTALSDIRHKTIVEDTRLQVSDIARMRAVRYLWNDGREDNGMHVGSIAQDWQQILPEVVLRANNDEGTLSLQYGVAALISSITIARKVVNHEQRITELEKECERLRFENEQLRLKIA